jgi:hypothetical protein
MQHTAPLVRGYEVVIGLETHAQLSTVSKIFSGASTRFGAAPSRLATLGYDSVLLTLNVARGWKPGTLFPTAKLYGRDGFIGLDGVFRFEANGVAERAMEVREVDAGTFLTASPAPAKFNP